MNGSISFEFCLINLLWFVWFELPELACKYLVNILFIFTHNLNYPEYMSYTNSLYLHVASYFSLVSFRAIAMTVMFVGVMGPVYRYYASIGSSI